MAVRRINRSPRSNFKIVAQPWHKRVMLEYLGVADIPQSIKAIDVLLEDARNREPKEYERAYSIVVDKFDPDKVVTEKGLTTKLEVIEVLNDEISKFSSMIDAKTEAASTQIKDLLGHSFTESYENLKQAALGEAELIKSQTLKLIDEKTEQFRKVKYVIAKKDAPEIDVEGPLPEEFQDILDLADMRMNVLLVGPAGCGKTHIAKVVSQALGLDFSAQSCSAGMSESILAGWLLPVEKSGQFVYVSSEFVRIYENGGVFLFDEIDAADSNTMLFLNQALANGEFYLPQRFKDPKVKKHKDFVAIAAANTFGTGATVLYNGRNSLDAATLDRFRMGVIEMDYSPTVEEALVDTEVLAWGRGVRFSIKKHNLNKILSTRFLLDATKMKQQKEWPMQKIANGYFRDWSREEKAMLEREIA